MTDRLRVYFVEGNIGSGKSTILKALEAAGYQVSFEPVDHWTTQFVQDGANLLDLYYKDMNQWSFEMEVAAMTTRILRLTDALTRAECDPSRRVLVVERSFMTDLEVFAKHLHAKGFLKNIQLRILQELYVLAMVMAGKILRKCDISHIYVRTLPGVCHSRRSERDRVEERADSMTPDYLIDLHNRHETWLFGGDSFGSVHVIDGGGSREEVFNTIVDFIK